MKLYRNHTRLPDHKERTLATPQIGLPEIPPFVVIPFSQFRTQTILPTVREGDFVSVGTKIAEGSGEEGVPIFSSVSGVVLEVKPEYIQIKSDEVEQLEDTMEIQPSIPLEADYLLELIHNAGVVDLGGSGCATHYRLKEARREGVQTLILNGCESEPFETADHMLMMNYSLEVLKGAELMRIACDAKRAVIVSTTDKSEAIEIVNSKNYSLKLKTVETKVLPTRYPQGSESLLYEAVTGKRLRRDATTIGSGVLVENVATAFAVYEAAYLKKPLYERIITVTGPCVAEPRNLWARSGTRAIDLLQTAKGLLRDPDRILFGGPMMGQGIPDLHCPMTLGVSSIVALPPELTPQKPEEACIRCGECVAACPEALVPEMLVRAIRSDALELAEEFDMSACTECGNCAYTCPSDIPIVSIIQEGKLKSKQSLVPREPIYSVGAPKKRPTEAPAN